MAKDRLRHRRIDLPSYQFVVYQRPLSSQNKLGRQHYKDAVILEAREHISIPISSNDVEVEICWATRIRDGIRADIDNIIKPSLDALVGIAFNDDKQVRSVTSTLIDRKHKSALEAYVEDLGPLIYVDKDDAVQIAIYSDTRLNELGGQQVVQKKRHEELTQRSNEAEKQGIQRAWDDYSKQKEKRNK